MPVNPATKSEHLKSPITRANEVNDPSFENQQGYFPYNLTHAEFCSLLFGEITPTMHLDTVPADRIVVNSSVKTILNQINGNFLSTLNQYHDSFYVPFRCVYPNNYEKLIPNPTKGNDLPNSALPVVPLFRFFHEYLFSDDLYIDAYSFREIYNDLSLFVGGDISNNGISYYLARVTLLATVLSRGQLLDYLGYSFDITIDDAPKVSRFQDVIDRYFTELRGLANATSAPGYMLSVSLTNDDIPVIPSVTFPSITRDITTLSQFRSWLSDSFESGKLPYLDLSSTDLSESFMNALSDFLDFVDSLFSSFIDGFSLETIDSLSNPFESGGYVNIGKILAYQQSIAQYYTNDSVDNIFNADLYMQLLRATMFPSTDGLTREPIFLYNGVQTEYDLISTGAFYHSLLKTDVVGVMNRQYVYMTLMFLKRRSLRYGDYFSTARPRMLAVGDLSIPVGDGVAVVDVTKNLLMQRYLNAVNYIGSGFLQYMTSQFGVKPSDTGTYPRFLGHRKVELQSQITNNTANDQGAQTTNLVGYVDDNLAFDVFIDDFGFILSVISYDVMPIYKSGIDICNYFADRFDFFNPMLQNIGDQPIRLSSLLGAPDLYNTTFGYTMRNAELKFKVSKAHGAFVNSLSGFLLSYPLEGYLKRNEDGTTSPDINISPDFIRDKPMILDSILPRMTGISPAEYFHFIVAVLNDVKCARKIQSTPPILF